MAHLWGYGLNLCKAAVQGKAVAVLQGGGAEGCWDQPAQSLSRGLQGPPATGAHCACPQGTLPQGQLSLQHLVCWCRCTAACCCCCACWFTAAHTSTGWPVVAGEATCTCQWILCRSIHPLCICCGSTDLEKYLWACRLVHLIPIRHWNLHCS